MMLLNGFEWQSLVRLLRGGVVFVAWGLFYLQVSHASSYPLEGQIYFIRGNILDFHSDVHQQAETELEQIIKSKFQSSRYRSVHNHSWKRVCEDIIQAYSTNRLYSQDQKLVLIGHSWGAQVSWSISRCLQEKIKKSIDLVIALDPVQKPFHPDVRIVPDNIERVYAASQPDGFWFQRGVRELYRENGSQLGISFRALDFDGHPKAHDMVILELMRDGTIEGLLESVIHGNTVSFTPRGVVSGISAPLEK